MNPNFVRMLYQMELKIDQILNSNRLFNTNGSNPDMKDVTDAIRNDSNVFNTLQKDVKTILSINCGDATCEQYVIDELFPHINNENVIHTDILIPSDNKNGVIKKSAATALENHVTDLVLCFFPYFGSEGYSNIIAQYFKAKYLIFVGEFYEDGSCDPGNLISQIEKNMEILIIQKITNEDYASSDCVVVCKMKK